LPRLLKKPILASENMQMSESIYKFFMGRFLEPWYQLSKEEQDNLIAKLDDAKKKFGCTQPIECNSSWSSDQWSFAGYEVYPNIEAVQKYIAALQEFNWFRYCESTSVLGTKSEP
jgi:hypothetical protein